jgi:predicted Zn-dependent peptidase
MCAGEAYGIPRLGDEATTEKLTLKKLHTVYSKLISTSRLELFYSGSADLKRVEQALLAAFSTLPRENVEGIPATAEHPARGEVKYVEEAMDVTQGKLGMGFSCGSDDSAAILMGNTLFGGSSNSKLFMNVREKLGLCYYCSSAMDLIKGTMMVNCGIDPAKKEIAQAEILHQLDEIRQMHITDAEFDAAKKSLRSAIRQVYDEPSSMEMWWLGRMLSGRDTTPEEEIAYIENVTKSDVAAAAQNIQLDTVYFMNGTGGEVADDE